MRNDFADRAIAAADIKWGLLNVFRMREDDCRQDFKDKR